MPEENGIPTLYTIDKKVSEITILLKNNTENTAKDIDRHQKKLERHDLEFYGDGTDNNPGQKTLMVRFILIQRICVWVICTLATGVIGLILSATWNIITKLRQ